MIHSIRCCQIRKVQFPAQKVCMSKLRSSESSKSCPKFARDCSGIRKARNRAHPQTRKASGAPLALSARRAFSQRCRSNSMSHQHCRSDYLATRFRKSWAANSNRTAGQKAFRPDFAGLSESSTSPKQRRRRVTDFVRGCPHIATAPQQHLALPH